MKTNNAHLLFFLTILILFGGAVLFLTDSGMGIRFYPYPAQQQAPPYTIRTYPSSEISGESSSESRMFNHQTPAEKSKKSLFSFFTKDSTRLFPAGGENSHSRQQNPSETGKKTKTFFTFFKRIPEQKNTDDGLLVRGAFKELLRNMDELEDGMKNGESKETLKPYVKDVYKMATEIEIEPTIIEKTIIAFKTAKLAWTAKQKDYVSEKDHPELNRFLDPENIKAMDFKSEIIGSKTRYQNMISD